MRRTRQARTRTARADGAAARLPGGPAARRGPTTERTVPLPGTRPETGRPGRRPRTRKPGTGPGLRRPAGTAALLAAAVLGLLLAAAGPAAAHAALVKTDPGQGAVVKTAPRQVVLTFGEGVTLQSDALRVFAPDGSRVDRGAPGHAGGRTDTARIALRGGLPKGTFTVAWKVISADTHPVGGAFTFSVGHASATSAVPGEKPSVGGSPAVEWLYQLARGVAYAAFALLVGAAAFGVLLWPRALARRDVRRLLQGSWAALLVATAAVLLLYGPHTAGGGAGKAFSLSLARTSLGTRLGTSLALRMLLLAAFAVFLSVLAVKAGALRRAGGRGARWAFGVCGGLLSGGLAATWAAADHASVGTQVPVALPLDLVHLLAMALWLGGLVTLLCVLRRGADGPAVPAAPVRAFSRLAFWCVVALAASGVYQGWRQTGSWQALLDTGYGQLLLVKTGCVAVLVGVAGGSRRWTRLLADRGAAAADGGADGAEDGADGAKDGADGRGGARVPRQSGAPAEAREPAAGSAGSGESPAAGAEASAAGTGARPVPPSAKRRAQLERQRAARQAAQRARAERLDPAPAMLRRSVLAEAGVAVVVLAVTTLLTNTSPGRNAAEAASSAGGGAPSASAPATSGPIGTEVPFDTGGAEHGRGKVSVTLDPGRTGRNEIHLQVLDPKGHPMAVPELDVAMTLKSKGIGPITFKPESLGDGHYVVPKAQLPMAGRWQLGLTVRTSAIDEITETTKVEIR